MTKNTSFKLCLFAVMAIAGFYSFSANSQDVKSLKVGDKAPDIVAEPLNEDENKDYLDKKGRFHLEKVENQVILVDFWASWCPPCREEIPHLQKAYEKFHEKGLKLVSVSLDRKESDLIEFTKKKENNMPWTHIFDETQELAKKYRVRFIPSPFLIDHKGKIVAMENELRGGNLEKSIEKHIKQLPKEEEKSSEKAD